jgi:protein AATF/BFR2
MPAKRNKTAKTTAVDRRASKGRKIRYAVVPKLVNFTFPVSRPEPTISEDVWFKSLFGGGGGGGGNSR